ncbi:cupin domain-containing protein [Methyloceanibacter sp.]|uniref:cupin domain-containing protein n=1 Tax=Methyloceanibacter sp. TaxID=1965321 RepID=UPI002C25AC1F|nr:cupin domain-containing protein [Methyloceanibacter sp.]HML93125.1 cupin domain-containing protein [Methyloceanibacter sp.]
MERRSAEEIIAHLALEQHPEGGWYRETFRDTEGHAGRPHSTAILFLLAEGDVSHWHRVDAVETWHWYGGAPLLLTIAVGGGATGDFKLGPDLFAGEHPQAVVPAHAWQSARSLGAWTLTGCTVAPGFRFEGFELAPPGWTPENQT